jgi:UDP-N-acetylbacillosamine N-acetyltransferase
MKRTKSSRSKTVCIIGAGGHTRSLINALELNGFSITGIYDDSYKPNDERINGYPVLGKIKDAPKTGLLVLSTGDNALRARWCKSFLAQVYAGTIIHPQALVENRVELGDHNQIFAGVYINANATIGRNNILNTNCILEHEAVIGDHNHISVGAILCGRVTIGNRCFIGAGAVVIDRTTVCNDVVIGANSVVIDDIREPGTYVGNPARKIK